MADQLFEVIAADVAVTADDCYTPRWIFDAADLIFDMDVAAPADSSRRTCPARRYLTPIEDGLTQPWDAMAIISSDFIRPDGGIKRIPYALILAGCGERAVDAVARVAAADKYAGGAYHVRPV